MSLLLGLAIRSSVIVLLALAGSALLRGRSAALRHLVLAVGVLCAAAVLPLMFVLPAWDIPLSAATPRSIPAPAVVQTSDATGPSQQPVTRQTVSTPQILAIVWAIGFAGCAATLLAGFGRLAWTTSRAEHVRDGSWLRLAEQISATYGLKRPITLLQADGPAVLATWGLFRPRVLLPAEARQWSEDRAHVVLCHELAHVRRRDWLVQMSAEALRTVYWFNPLLWIACGRLRRESEQACDDAVLDTGVPPRDYAAHLLEIARSCRRFPPAWTSAMPIAHTSTLERRIAVMLNPRLNREALTRRAIIVTAVALLAVTLPTATFRASAQQAPLALSGSVYDPTGAVMQNVDLTLEDARQVKWQTTTDASGRFEFAPIGQGRYVLTAALAGFRPLRHEFDLRRASDWEQPITLQVGTLQETITVTERRTTGSTASARRTSGAPVRVGGIIRPPAKLVDVRPAYPQAMRDAGLEGVVPIEALIGRDGAVVSVRVISAQVHPAFAKAAVDAVRQWQFESTLLNGEPVEVVMTVSVRFNLSD